MTTHQCPTCKHEHDTPHQAERLIRSINVLAVIANTAAHVGAPIRSIGLAPGHISISVVTESGLRELATELLLPEPIRDDQIMESQGDYIGVTVYLSRYVGGDQ